MWRREDTRRGGGRLGGLPEIGKQFGQAAGRMGADALEHIAQVGEGIDVEPLAGGDEAGQDRGGAAALVAAEERKRPVNPSFA